MRLLQAKEIAELASRGIIIRQQFRRANCDGMAYGLTLGTRYQSITLNEGSYRTIAATLVLGPRESVNVEINERFNFNDEDGKPAYVGLIVAGARLLAGGISHPTTFVDAGADHATTLTLVNLRNFPSRSFRPGSDIIAKMLVFQLDEDEIPEESWTRTSPYLQAASRDELPVLWADFHLVKEWAPAGTPRPHDLDGVPALGPPYDVVTAHLLDQTRRLDDLEQAHHGRRATRERQREERTGRVRFWLTIAVAFVSAVLGAFLQAWVSGSNSPLP